MTAATVLRSRSTHCTLGGEEDSVDSPRDITQASPLLWVVGQICQTEVDLIMEGQIMGETALTMDHLVIGDPEIIEDPPNILLKEDEIHLMAHPMVLQEVEMTIMALEEVATMTTIMTAVAVHLCISSR